MSPDVDESQVRASTTAELVRLLATMKAQAVWARVSGDAALLGCDSLLDLDGHPQGKPGSPEESAARWRAQRGRTGTLYTGHHLIVRRGDQVTTRTQVGATKVTFAEVSDAEIAAYVATGEPDWVAGAFTIDGYGSAFVTDVVGDPSNVIGLSLPLLRTMLNDADVPWTSLWELAGQ